jgi:hypothetical protein
VFPRDVQHGEVLFFNQKGVYDEKTIYVSGSVFCLAFRDAAGLCGMPMRCVQMPELRLLRACF